MLRRAFALALAALFVAGLAACNTMKGLGQDVEKLGDKIEQKAEQKKSY